MFYAWLQVVLGCIHMLRKIQLTPPPPTGLSHTMTQEGIFLWWTKSADPGVTGYEVIRTGGGETVEFGVTANVSVWDPAQRGDPAHPNLDMHDDAQYTYAVRAVKADPQGGATLKSAEAAQLSVTYDAQAQPAVVVTGLTEGIDPFCLIAPDDPDQAPLPPVVQVRLEAQRVVDRVEVVFTGDGGRELGTHEVSVPPVGGPVDVFWPPTGHPCPGELPEWADVLSGEQIDVTLYVYFRFDPSEIVVVNSRARLARRQVGQVVRSYVLKPVGAGLSREASNTYRQGPQALKVCIAPCAPPFLVEHPPQSYQGKYPDPQVAHTVGVYMPVSVCFAQGTLLRTPVLSAENFSANIGFNDQKFYPIPPEKYQYDESKRCYRFSNSANLNEDITQEGINLIIFKLQWTDGNEKRHVTYYRTGWFGGDEQSLYQNVAQKMLDNVLKIWETLSVEARSCFLGFICQQLDGVMAVDLVNYLDQKALEPSAWLMNQTTDWNGLKVKTGFTYNETALKCEVGTLAVDVLSSVGAGGIVKEVTKNVGKKGLKKVLPKLIKDSLKELGEKGTSKTARVVLDGADEKLKKQLVEEAVEGIEKELVGNKLEDIARRLAIDSVPEKFRRFLKTARGKLPASAKKALLESVARNPDGAARVLLKNQHDEVGEALGEVMEEALENPPAGLKGDIQNAIEQVYEKVTACVRGNSFAGGTQVVTGQGLRNIEQVGAGEKVFGHGEGAGAPLCAVARAWGADGEPVVQLAYHPLGPKTGAADKPLVLRLTPGHEVWSVSAGAWRAAAELQPGERLRLFDGGEAAVVRVIPEAAGPRGPPRVYDLQVPGASAFFALPHDQQQPGHAVWVHNGVCAIWKNAPWVRGKQVEEFRVLQLGIAGKLKQFQKTIDWISEDLSRIVSIKSVDLKKSYQSADGLKNLASTLKGHFKSLDDFVRGGAKEKIRYLEKESVEILEDQIQSREIHYGIESLEDAPKLVGAMEKMVESLKFEGRLPANTVLESVASEPHLYKVGDIFIKVFEAQ